MPDEPPDPVPKHTRQWKEACSALISAQVRLGRLPSARDLPCAACVSVKARVYHHPDYDHPELVVPLCGPCHACVHHSKKQWDMKLILAIGLAWYAHRDKEK